MYIDCNVFKAHSKVNEMTSEFMIQVGGKLLSIQKVEVAKFSNADKQMQ